LVAAIRQVPLEDAEIVGVADESESAQPEAVPPDEIAYVTEPVPDPPDGVMVKDCEYG
jgi:hypothetical protein